MNFFTFNPEYVNQFMAYLNGMQLTNNKNVFIHLLFSNAEAICECVQTSVYNYDDTFK